MKSAEKMITNHMVFKEAKWFFHIHVLSYKCMKTSFIAFSSPALYFLFPHAHISGLQAYYLKKLWINIDCVIEEPVLNRNILDDFMSDR